MKSLFVIVFLISLVASVYFFIRFVVVVVRKQQTNSYKKKLVVSLITLVVSLLVISTATISSEELEAKREKFQIEKPTDDGKLYEQKLLNKTTEEKNVEQPEQPKELTPEEKAAKEAEKKAAEEKRIAEQKALEEKRAQEEARRQTERQAAEERRRQEQAEREKKQREESLAKTLRVTPYEFVQRFNDSAYELGVGGLFDIGEPQIQSGSVQNATKYIFNDKLSMLEIISKENGNIKELTVLVNPSQNVEQFRANLMSCIAIYSAAVKATNLNLTLDDVAIIQENLGLNKPITEWGNDSSTIYDGRKYVKQLIKGVGFSFIISMP